MVFFTVWSSWHQEGDCSETCDGGELLITRVCSDGGNCYGASKRILTCNTMQCPGIYLFKNCKMFCL